MKKLTLNKTKDTLVNWAQNDPNIHALISIESRAKDNLSDELSDFDISVFYEDFSVYDDLNQWTHKLGKLWVNILEKIEKNGKFFPHA